MKSNETRYNTAWLSHFNDLNGLFYYLWCIRWERGVKREHLWRHLIGSRPFLAGRAWCLIGCRVHDGDLFLPGIHFEERAGLSWIWLRHWAHTHHHLHLETQKLRHYRLEQNRIRQRWNFILQTTQHRYRCRAKSSNKQNSTYTARISLVIFLWREIMSDANNT